MAAELGPTCLGDWMRELRHALAEGVAVVRILAVLRAEGGAFHRAALGFARLGRIQRRALLLVQSSLCLRGHALTESILVVRARAVELREALVVMVGREVRVGLLGGARRSGADPVLVGGMRPHRDAPAHRVPALALNRAVALAKEIQAEGSAESVAGAGAVFAILPRRAAAERGGRYDQGDERCCNQDLCLHAG